MTAPKITKDISNIIYSDKERGVVYNSVAALDLSPVEALRAIRDVRAKALEMIAVHKASLAALNAEIAYYNRASQRCDDTAMDILREQRELHGPTTETGMYKIDMNDGTDVALMVRPSESVEVNEAAVASLPDELCKITRSPKLDLIKGQLKLGWTHEGVTLVTKKYGTTPPASEDVRW